MKSRELTTDHEVSARRISRPRKSRISPALHTLLERLLVVLGLTLLLSSVAATIHATVLSRTTALPETSVLPLLGLFGVLSVWAALALRTIRKNV